MPDPWRVAEVIFAGGVFLFTGALVIVSYRQWDAASQSARAAQSAAQAAQAANTIAQTSLETSERAYVNIENFKVTDFEKGKTPLVSCVFHNTGHKPASGLQFFGPIEYGKPYPIYDPTNQARGDFISPNPEDVGETLGPEESKPWQHKIDVKELVRLSNEMKKSSPNVPIPGFDIGKILAGRESFEISVGVGYRDGFNHARTTWQAWRYDSRLHTFANTSSRES